MVGVTHVPTRLGRRRPTGEAPALPRHVSRTTRLYAALVVAGGALWLVRLTRAGATAVTAVDRFVLDRVVALRADPLDRAMKVVAALGSDWAIRVLGWPTLVALVALRRFQRLVVLLAVTLVVVTGDAAMTVVIGRMRPDGVEILESWRGYAHPSMPVAMLGLTLVGALYTLVPGGSWRSRLGWPAVAVVGLLAAARVYLGVDHPTDALAAVVTGMGVPAIAFRLLTPDDVMPVTYRRGRRAHLDVGGRRGAAIVNAARAQLGIEVVGVEAFALSGSAGSTPVRVTVRHGDGTSGVLFGKLYATVHLRSDRWYKLGRTVMYGRLEDERSFNTVRRLVEYEDHMLRVARDAGLPSPAPLGFVEITPEREYLLLTEFFDGAEPIERAAIDDAAIDEGLGIVRRMWDTGLAHRDIKPANLLVRDGQVFLIDLAFAAMRPTPWRQAVDLANMMTTLALYTSPERVYERALRVFTPADIAEAFAASRGATVPAQLRALVKRDGRHVARRLRALAPAYPAVSIQRWTVRRVVLTLGLLVAVAVTAGLFMAYLEVAGLL